MHNDLLGYKNKYRKLIIYILLTIFILLSLGSILSWWIYYFKSLSLIPNQSDLISLLGSISGGIIGGVGTIIAVILSISKTDEIQRLHELEYKKRKATII